MSGFNLNQQNIIILGNAFKHLRYRFQIMYSWVIPAHSSLILCDPRDCSLPGSSVHGTSQERILE